MGIFVTAVIGLAIWVILWSVGHLGSVQLKGIDAFMVPLAMVLIAFVVRLRSAGESAEG